MTGVQGATVIPRDPTDAELCTAGAPVTGSAPNMVWLFGSSDFGPELRAVQKALNASSTPYRAVFQNGTSCAGVNAIFTAPVKMKDPAAGAGGWAYYFDAAGNQVNCRIELSTVVPPVGVPIDIGISNLYSQTCNPAFTPGTTVRDYLGPIVPFVLAVKGTATTSSISTEAARLVFGYGGRAPGMKDAMPWTDYKTTIRSNADDGAHRAADHGGPPVLGHRPRRPTTSATACSPP
jgi:hypothetical protein